MEFYGCQILHVFSAFSLKPCIFVILASLDLMDLILTQTLYFLQESDHNI